MKDTIITKLILILFILSIHLPTLSYATTTITSTECLESTSAQSPWFSNLSDRLTKSHTHAHAHAHIHATESKESNESILSRFLGSHKLQNLPDHKFHLHGWRWHTLSLLRDTNRLERLALTLLQSSSLESKEEQQQEQQEQQEQQMAKIDIAASHVIDFNMKGLHRIENDLFFPWLKTRLENDQSRSVMQQTELEHEEVSDALMYMLKDIDRERDYVSKLGKAVREQSRIAGSSETSNSKRSEALCNIAQMSAALHSRTRGIMQLQDQFLIPCVAAIIPEKEQSSVNDKVIRKLGLFDSRVHLVGMYDAVWELQDEAERLLFQKVIPYIPRMMIPRWKNNLYLPQAGSLEMK